MDPEDNQEHDANLSSETGSLRRGGGGGGGDGGGGDRFGAQYYERYHINQFYNSVEDEQLYTDEYTNFIHTYNQFVINGNVMFARMEQTLRSQLERSIVRQSFYYHRYNDIFHARHPTSVNRNVYHVPLSATTTTTQVPVPAPVHAPAPAAASQGTNAQQQQPTRSNRSRLTDTRLTDTRLTDTRLTDTFGRLISSYLSSELERQHQQQQDAPSQTQTQTHTQAQATTNPFSLLYTYAQPILFRQNGGTVDTGNGRGSGGPTPEQINYATLNTTYANVASPVNTTCPISRDEFNDESEITVIRGCHHIFNRSSLREWFINHSTCPMCRNDIRNYRAGAGSGSDDGCGVGVGRWVGVGPFDA